MAVSALVSEPPAYQWTVTKSMTSVTWDSTVWFQSPGSPSPVMPSGQLPGAVRTAPILTVGSTAFIAAA